MERERLGSDPYSSYREYCRMHASKPRLGNDITKSYLASFAQGIFRRVHNPLFSLFYIFYNCFRGGKTCTILRNIQSFR
ncbi:hypothetical protein Hdeb2414_s0007g00243421 [Helianthus debilis subsp. tardiflorus]